MRKITLLLLSSALIASTAWAGGSIFKHKTKTTNTNGVYSIGVHVCGKLECPEVRIVEGKCDGEHMSKHWGVCVCDKGYVAQGTKCEVCPDGQYSDGIHGCTGCAPGMYKANENDTKCTECPDGYYCVDGIKHACPGENAATCDNTGATTSCADGYYMGNTQCVENGKCADGSDPTIRTYQSGECCSTTMTIWNYCPGDTIPTCTREASCDYDETTCTGDYEESSTGGHICCATDEAECSEDGPCICKPKGIPQTQWDCDVNACITCGNDEVAKCGYYECACGLSEKNVDCYYDCIVCKEGEVAKCTEMGQCFCIPDGIPSTQWDCGDSDCIVCAEGETAMCSTISNCVCKNAENNVKCNYFTCQECAANEVVRCADGGNCYCGPDENAIDCNDGTCKVCAAGEIARCTYEDCYCAPDENAIDCNDWTCKVCAAGEVARCIGNGNCACGADEKAITCNNYVCKGCATGEVAYCQEEAEEESGCTCVPEGAPSTQWACNMRSCKVCAAGEVAECSYEGDCACGPDGNAVACGLYSCQTCNAGETAMNSDLFDGVCVPEGEKGMCNQEYCVSCPMTSVFTGYCGTCPIYCAAEASECMDDDCCNHFGGNGDWVEGGVYICCASGHPELVGNEIQCVQ